MKRLSFALGSPPPHSKRGTRDTKKPVLPRTPLPPHRHWRILPSTQCDGLVFWIDTLPGASFLQKRTSLLHQMDQIETSDCWSFDRDTQTASRDDRLQKANRVMELLHQNQTIRWILKRFLTRARLFRFPILNDTDPITLEAVETPIQIPSFAQRKTYVFEAESFARLVHKKLLAHDGQIPLPQFPKNPLTNEPFSFTQQMSLLQQCREAGYSSWTLEAYVASRYDREQFFCFFKTPLRLSAIRTTLATLRTWEAIDTLMDFVESQHTAHSAQFYATVYKWAIQYAPTSTRIESWRKLCLQWYEQDLLIEDPDSKQVAFRVLQAKTLSLCSSPTDLQELRFKTRSTLDGSRRISTVPGSR
jgi:hypothetical protein